MAERKELDPYKGVFRWAYTRARFDHLRGTVVGFVVVPVLSAIFNAIYLPASTSSLHARIQAGIVAGLATFGIVLLISGIAALTVAAVEQRNELRFQLADTRRKTGQVVDSLQHEFHYKETTASSVSWPDHYDITPVIVYSNDSPASVKHRVEVLSISIEGCHHDSIAQNRREGVTVAGRDMRFTSGVIPGVPNGINPLRGVIETVIFFAPAGHEGWSYVLRQKHELTLLWTVLNTWSVSTVQIESSVDPV